MYKSFVWLIEVNHKMTRTTSAFTSEENVLLRSEQLIEQGKDFRVYRIPVTQRVKIREIIQDLL